MNPNRPDVHTPRLLALAAAVLATGLLLRPAQAATRPWNGKVHAPLYRESIFPPWQHGQNDPAIPKGFPFTVPEVDDLADFHGNPETAKLVLFVGGNYYFAMAPLVDAFEAEHPRLRGHIYYETLPPGILIRQMDQDGVITVGNMTWQARPDVYAAGLLKLKLLMHQGAVIAPLVPYVTNDLAIMIPEGNPGRVRGLADLGRPGLRLAMPNPAWEGVARQIRLSLLKAGGPGLARAVYVTKVRDGETLLTHIHHRQTPLFLMQGLAQAGVTWASEAIFQEQAGHPIRMIPIPARDNTTAIYAAAVVKGAPHPRAARAWLRFLKSPKALAIFERYGFRPYRSLQP